jgi:eukaryotic-like serine/threonine-protein kinase
MAPDRNDARLLELAGSVASGTPVNWQEVEQLVTDQPEAEEVRALRLVDRIAEIHRIGPFEAAHKTAEDVDQNRHDRPSRWRHLTALEHVGQGAFGDVYRAIDSELDREVAVKLLWAPETKSSATLSRLLKEARLLAKLRHPNVVTVYGAEFAEGRMGLWMEFIKGRTLEELLVSHVTFGDKEAAQIGQQLCRALAAVHRVGLVHRDIKARNVMREEGGRIVLMDFGAGADLHDETRASMESLAGTPLYLAPELFEAGPPTVSADIYSLGVLLFHLVTRSYPVEGRTAAEVQRAHQQRERKHLRDLRPDLSETFIRVVERAIDYEPRARYRTAGEFEAALASLSELAPGGRPAPVARWRWALGVAVLLVAIAGVAWWSAMRGTSTERQPEKVVATNPSTSPAGVVRGLPGTDYLATFHSLRNRQEIQLRQGAQVAPGDRLFLDFEASRPAFVYVVNQDEQGEAYLLFPLPGYTPINPLPPGQSHRLPGRQNGEDIYWQVSSAGGREHFYLFASAERPLAFEKLLAAMPHPELGKPVVSMPLPKDAVGVLRGVGPVQPNNGFRPAFPSLPALLDTRETASGLWEREITFENPAR